MLVKVANRLRWRKLANASPGKVALTKGEKWSLHPRYCTKAIAQLRVPASSQAVAALLANGKGEYANATTINTMPAPKVSSPASQMVEGPKVKGINQGKAMSRRATKVGIHKMNTKTWMVS